MTGQTASRRVLVTGSRDWSDVSAVYAALDAQRAKFPDLVVVHGDCPTGADSFARQWARTRGVPMEAYPARWERYGKVAGPKRNQRMVDLGADVCLAFPLGASRGTRDCMRRAVVAGIPVVDMTSEADQ